MKTSAEVRHVFTRNLSLFCGMLLLGACGQQAGDPGMGTAEPVTQQSTKAAQSGSSRESQLAFLNRIREADPRNQTIERALMNEKNELGLILNRNVEMDSIPELMKTMLTQMAREFPGEDLTVIAYTPSNPPVEIGTARLDSRTREMTFTWANGAQRQRRGE